QRGDDRGVRSVDDAVVLRPRHRREGGRLMTDLHNMQDHGRISFWAGTGFVAAMLAVIALVISDFNGVFSSDVHVTARVPHDGAVVAENSAVHYHGVKVGNVTET